MEWLQQIDASLFYLINSRWSNPVFDILLPIWREKWIWAPAYLFLIVFIWQNWKGQKGLVAILGLATVIGLSDFTSSTIIKKNVERIRPCNNPEMMAALIQRVDCGSGFSFTSSHAANHFAIAVYVTMLFGRLSRWICPAVLSWAFLVAFAQVYVGVHYPGDILAGGLLGAAIGWSVAWYIKYKDWFPAG